MALTTVNKLSNDAENAINNLIERDNIDWLELETYEGKIGIYDSDEEEHYTLKDGLCNLLGWLDYSIDDEDYDLSENELKEFRNLCKVLHINCE